MAGVGQRAELSSLVRGNALLGALREAESSTGLVWIPQLCAARADAARVCAQYAAPDLWQTQGQQFVSAGSVRSNSLT